MMTPKILVNYIAAWNSGQVEKVMAFFDEGLLYEDLALKKSLTHDQVRDFISGSFTNNAKISFEIISACNSGKAIAWEWIMTRVKKETGETTKTPGMSMTEFKDGKIIRNRDYWSTMPTPH